MFVAQLKHHILLSWHLLRRVKAGWLYRRRWGGQFEPRTFNLIFITLKTKKTMSKKTFNLITGIVGGVQAIGVAVVTYTAPEYATAINSAIVVIGTAIIEACSQFVQSE